MVGDKIEEILPQQVVYFTHAVKNKFLKRRYDRNPKAKVDVVKKKKAPSKVDIIAKELKVENNNGSD